MELRRIKLNNFRQFQNEQSIEFAKGNKNITVIFGENGKGKTGIFRALVFGIFGLTKLPQDDLNTKLHLVNFKKLDENQGIPVEATVEIDFDHNGLTYVIERTIVGIKEKNKIDERVTGQKLSIKNEQNTVIETTTDEREIKQTIKSVLNEEIKDFFLFDGEKIEALAKTNNESRKDIKKGITKLLQIESLEKAISLTKELYNKQDKKIRTESSNNDLKKIGDAVEELEKKIIEEKEKKEQLISEKELCSGEIDAIQEKLAENQDIKNIQQEVNQLSKDIKNQKVLLAEKKNSMKRNSISESYSLFLENTFLNTSEYLDQIYFAQKDNIPIGIIEKILKEGKCICGTDLNETKSALEQIEKLKNSYERSGMTAIINKIKDSYHDFENRKEEKLEEIRLTLQEIRRLKDQIDELELRKEKYSDNIKELSRKEKNLEELEKAVENKKKNFNNYQLEIRVIEKNQEELEKHLIKVKEEYRKAQDNDTGLRKSYIKINYLEKMKDNLDMIFTNYTSNMREQLENEATNIFKKIIDPKDREVINKISINKNYEIEVLNWNGLKITQDISQGQRQMVALSFVTALAKIASGGKDNIDFPLFMDTPFGRVSGNNRDNLIENIPYLTSQWVLLLTDTEYTAAEEFKLKSTDKLGMMYKLEQIGPGHTQIIKLSTDETLATRRI